MTIKPLLKPKRKKKSELTKLKEEADKAFQEWGRRTYNIGVFGGSNDCLHHYIHKSQSTMLRWDKRNGVPIKTEDHCRVHSQNNPLDVLTMTSYMKRLWGDDWEEYIRDKKREIFKPTKKQMLLIIEELND